MTEEIDAIIFDAGGTLIDTKPSRAELAASVLAERGHKVDKRKVAKAFVRADRVLDDEFARLTGKDESPFWRKYDRRVLEELGIEDDVSEFASALVNRFHDQNMKVESWVAYPDVKPTLKALSKRDMTIGMVSNATELLTRVLDNIDLRKYFEFVVISDEVGARKPSHKIFSLALKEAGTSPNRAVYVGDKLAVDILGAKRAGLNAILVDREDVFPDAKCIRIRDLTFLQKYF